MDVGELMSERVVRLSGVCLGVVEWVGMVFEWLNEILGESW